MNFTDLINRARLHHREMSTTQRQELTVGQRPVALFITCSDSRIVPAAITGAEPGTLFEMRTAGNVVPEYAPDSASSEMATIEYAVLKLHVPEIVICGHSHCGAVDALITSGRGLDELPALRTWLAPNGQFPARSEPARGNTGLHHEGREHLLAQLDTLANYPFIRQRIEAGELRLHGWFLDIGTGAIHRCEPGAAVADFLPL